MAWVTFYKYHTKDDFVTEVVQRNFRSIFTIVGETSPQKSYTPPQVTCAQIVYFFIMYLALNFSMPGFLIRKNRTNISLPYNNICSVQKDEKDYRFWFIIYANIFIHLWPKIVIHTAQPPKETWFNSME